MTTEPELETPVYAVFVNSENSLQICIEQVLFMGKPSRYVMSPNMREVLDCESATMYVPLEDLHDTEKEAEIALMNMLAKKHSYIVTNG